MEIMNTKICKIILVQQIFLSKEYMDPQGF
jgi:hypothetical protein